MSEKVDIEFGAMAPKLSEQRIAAFLSPDDVKRFEMIADALTVVTIHGYMPRSMSDKSRDRLAKRIFKAAQMRIKP